MRCVNAAIIAQKHTPRQHFFYIFLRLLHACNVVFLQHNVPPVLLLNNVAVTQRCFFATVYLNSNCLRICKATMLCKLGVRITTLCKTLLVLLCTTLSFCNSLAATLAVQYCATCCFVATTLLIK